MGKKTDRSGKVLIDWYQNNERKTTIAVYSLRAREHPTVSTPVTWEEVEAVAESGDASELVFEAGDVLERIEKHGDLFAPVLELKQQLPKL
jgi:bifunctional non-homologous end joining protein LigD